MFAFDGSNVMNGLHRAEDEILEDVDVNDPDGVELCIVEADGGPQEGKVAMMPED